MAVEQEEEWFVIMFGTGGRGGDGGWRAAAHRCLETVKDGSQACAPESGKERAEERSLGRARVEEEEKAATCGKTGNKKGSCVSLLDFKFWSFKPNCGYFKKKNMFVILGKPMFPLGPSKPSNSQHIHRQKSFAIYIFSAPDMVNKCIYFIIYFFIFLV